MKIQFALLLAVLLQVTYGTGNESRIVQIENSAPATLFSARGACIKRNYTTIYAAKRGDTLRVDTLKNNQYGGFMRFSLVPKRDMYKKEIHDRLSFFFSCADTHTTRCNGRTRQLCLHDKRREHFSHYFPVPEVYPNGVYVLGIARYGSFPEIIGNTTNIGAGDYFGCVRIRIEGGPLTNLYITKFTSEHSVTGKYKYCRSTSTNLHCLKSFCRDKHAPFVRPDEFRGRIKTIRRNWFRKRVSSY